MKNYQLLEDEYIGHVYVFAHDYVPIIRTFQSLNIPSILHQDFQNKSIVQHLYSDNIKLLNIPDKKNYVFILDITCDEHGFIGYGVLDLSLLFRKRILNTPIMKDYVGNFKDIFGIVKINELNDKLFYFAKENHTESNIIKKLMQEYQMWEHHLEISH